MLYNKQLLTSQSMLTVHRICLLYDFLHVIIKCVHISVYYLILFLFDTLSVSNRNSIEY